MDFEKKIERIKEIIKNLNSDELSLKDGMKLYEEGTKEIKDAQKMLQEAQNTFKELSAQDSDSNEDSDSLDSKDAR